MSAWLVVYLFSELKRLSVVELMLKNLSLHEVEFDESRSMGDGLVHVFDSSSELTNFIKVLSKQHVRPQ